MITNSSCGLNSTDLSWRYSEASCLMADKQVLNPFLLSEDSEGIREDVAGLPASFGLEDPSTLSLKLKILSFVAFPPSRALFVVKRCCISSLSMWTRLGVKTVIGLALWSLWLPYSLKATFQEAERRKQRRWRKRALGFHTLCRDELWASLGFSHWQQSPVGEPSWWQES